ncbi:MAG TPA: glucose-6-phosphate dehydrogenase assembly protein OpcA [Candidatus Dormibacteraeota bacterium]|nr:glucose-6-phosphate dehydrogenase assembly protein OpcA [Candidatus Dormibacteraeota bacterium]
MAAVVSPRTERQSWTSHNTSIPEVLEQLGRLQVQTRPDKEGMPEQPHPRGMVLNLIVVAPSPQASRRAVALMDSLAGHHPFRGVVLSQGSDPGYPGIGAEVDVHTSALLDAVGVLYERVSLWGIGGDSEHLLNMADALLIDDLPTYVWWVGDPPLHEPWFRKAIANYHSLVVDSADFIHPGPGTTALSSLLDELGDGLGVSDMQWIRHRHWRELLAQVFNPPDRRGLLEGIDKVEIAYRRFSDSGPVPLLTGWLQSRLGWALEQASTDPNGAIEVQYTSAAGRPITLILRPVQTESLPERDLVALRVSTEIPDQKLKLSAWRAREELGRIHVQTVTAGGKVDQLRLVDLAERGELLLGCLMSRGRDPIYRQALKCAAELLVAVR